MRKFTVRVETYIDVEVDETKFTPEFMEKFREYFFPFQSIEEHVGHLGACFANKMISGDGFIEGYGEAKDFGLKFTDEGTEADIL